MKRFPLLLALTFAAAIFLAGGAHSALAQGAANSVEQAVVNLVGQGTVSGSGVAVVKRQPELMRMRLDVTASGKDLADALAKLKARREAALKVCSDLGAAPATLVAGAPHIAAENPQRKQIMDMLRQRARNGGRPAKKNEPAQINVATTLTAEWPLKGSDGEDLLVASQSLSDKIKSALVKSMPKEELSPEEEELQEEAAQEMQNYNNNGPKPGEPAFIFVAKVSKQDYTKAAAKAFAIAKDHAQRLAAAAGSSLGELNSVQGNDQMMALGLQRQMYNYNGMQDDDSVEQQFENNDEAIGLNPAEVRLTIGVSASFVLGK
jgi:uncharacterized protein YggE